MARDDGRTQAIIKAGIPVAAEAVGMAAGVPGISTLVGAIKVMMEREQELRINRVMNWFLEALDEPRLSTDEMTALVENASTETRDAVVHALFEAMRRVSLQSEPYIARLMARYVAGGLPFDRDFKAIARILADADADQISNLWLVAAELRKVDGFSPDARYQLAPTLRDSLHVRTPCGGDVLIANVHATGNGTRWDGTALPAGVFLPGWFFSETMRVWHSQNHKAPQPSMTRGA